MIVNYPIWDIPYLGGSSIVAGIAIFHVFIAHFAVGGSLFLVLTERKAYRENDDRVLAFVRRDSLLFLLITLVLGAVSGVGIWFAIGLVSPAATSALIHIFVWGWAIEWVFFLVEVTAALVYYYGWDRMDRATHLKVGWIYSGSAWMSLAVINGILTFMLTPGGWVQTRSFWDGFFNPTYLPSLCLRTTMTVALASLYALVAAALIRETDLRAKMVHYAARWMIPAFFLMPLCGLWYFLKLPPLAREIAAGGAPPVTIFLVFSILLSGLIFGFAYVGPFRRPETFSTPFAALILMLGFVVTGTGEWVREATRKPYIIYDYMYANSVRVEDVNRIRQAGVLASAKWSLVRQADGTDDLAAGREVFRAQCQSCHTVAGYNGINLLVKGWTPEVTDVQLRHLDTLKGFMPPFLGNTAERRALTDWLCALDEKGRR